MSDQGYGIMPNSVLFDKTLSDKEKLLFCLISSLCAEMGYCWANNLYLGGKLNITGARISGWVSSLQKKGYIHVTIDQKDGNKRTITIAENSKTSFQKQQEGIAENSKTPLAENSKHNNTIINKQINKQTNPTPPSSGLAFDLFWNLYPRREKKQNSEAKWKKLNDKDRQKILDTLPAFIAGKEIQYLPHPLTYLNQRRREDELPISQQAASLVPLASWSDEVWLERITKRKAEGAVVKADLIETVGEDEYKRIYALYKAKVMEPYYAQYPLLV